jgi:ATPase subunit of ABC transporter with duplicated ATPase domains
VPSPSCVVLDDLCFSWPDGASSLRHISGAFSRGRTGLVGANGCGKSTLLRLIAGELTPTSGSITASGSVDHLRQDVTRGAGTVADLLGITAIRAALHAIEAGAVDPRHFEIVGDDWDVEARAVAALSALDLPTDLDRAVTTLSGGEAMLTAICGVQLRGAQIALLDEPTNNLDGSSRERLHDVIAGWRGPLVVVSHDLELLDLLDGTAELREGRLTTFAGPYREYRAWLAEQQQAARQALRSAEQGLVRERRERIKAEERMAHSQRQGRKDRVNGKYPPIVLGQRRSSAEKSQGARRIAADARVSAAREAVAHAELAVREDDRIHIDLPDPGLPRGRRIAELPSADGRHHVISGPERVAILGANGVGKTTLLEALLPTVPVRVGYLPQRLLMDDCSTVLELMRTGAPHVPPAELRNRLARLLIRGDMVTRPVGSLSGGERSRVALAQLLLADPPPELIVLDEPTNDLDLGSVEQMVDAVAAYRGAVLVVSHDRAFLEQLQLDVTLRLDECGVLIPVW